MKERILITGGSGFIGSNVIEDLDSSGYDVLNIDALPPPDVSHQAFWKKMSILDEGLHNVLQEAVPDYVIHLAARTDLNGKTQGDYLVNTLGTSNLIGICEKTPSVKKIIFASSMLVCKVGHVPVRDDEYSADTQYGMSKVKMEKMIREKKRPWEWTIVRPTSIWGPGFKTPYRNFFDIVRSGRFLDIGEKYASKTYGYIGNTVYQIMQILKSAQSNGKVYYLGDDPPIFISDWGREIAKESGCGYPKKIPYGLFKMAAIAGDILKALHFNFPLNSFRLKNMTTNNIIDLRELYEIAPAPPYTRIQGVTKTISWLNKQQEIR